MYNLGWNVQISCKQREAVRTYGCFRWPITGTIQSEPPARVIAVRKIFVLYTFYNEVAGEIFQEILYEEALLKLTFQVLAHWSDEGLMLETSTLKLFTVANIRYQLSLKY